MGGTHCLVVISSVSGSVHRWQCPGYSNQLVLQCDPICAGSHQFLLLISSSCFFVKSASYPIYYQQILLQLQLTRVSFWCLWWRDLPGAPWYRLSHVACLVFAGSSSHGWTKLSAHPHSHCSLSARVVDDRKPTTPHFFSVCSCLTFLAVMEEDSGGMAVKTA